MHLQRLLEFAKELEDVDQALHRLVTDRRTRGVGTLLRASVERPGSWAWGSVKSRTSLESAAVTALDRR
jgi:hypothetical protein